MHEDFRRLAPATIVVEFVNQVRRLGPALLFFLVLQFAGQRGGGVEDRIELFGAIAGLLTVFPAIFNYYTTRFRITDQALELKSGWLFRQNRTIPLERIQNVTVTRNLVERALNVATLKIETASGGESEAQLSVVRFEDVESIEAQLRRPGEIHGIAQGDPIAPPEIPVVYRASIKDLVIAGATENRAGLIFASIIGLLGSSGLLQTRMRDLPLERLKNLDVATGIAFGAIALLVFILIGWLASMATTVAKYFDFTLSDDNEVLRIQHGLFSHVRSSIPRRRVQSASFQTPLLQRLSGFGRVMASSAASFKDESTGGRALVSPMVRIPEADSFIERILPGYTLQGLDYRMASPISWIRGAVGSMPLFAIIAGVLIATNRHAFLPIPGALFALSVFGSYKSWRVYRYAFSEDRVVTISGWLTRTTTIVPIDRIQWALASQSPFQRRWGVAEVKAYTASATAVDTIVIGDIPAEEAFALAQSFAISSDMRQTGGV